MVVGYKQVPSFVIAGQYLRGLFLECIAPP